MIPDKGALKKLLDSNSSTRYKNSTPPAISSIRSTASSPPPPPHLTVAELDGYSSVSRSTQSHQTQFNNYLLNSNSNFNSTKISSSQFKLKESISKLSGDDLEAEFHLNQNISTSNKESGMKDEGVRRDTDVWKELQQTLDEEKNNSQIHSCSNSNIHQRSQKSLKSSSETYSSLFHQKFDDNSSRTTNFYRPILPHSSPANFNSPIHPSFSKRPDSSVSSVEYWSRSAQSNIDHRPESLTCFISPQVTPEASRQSDVDHYHYSSNSSNYHLLNLSVPALYSPSPPPPISRKKSYSQQNHSSYSNSPEHYLPKPIWDYPSSPSPSSSSVTSFSTTSTGGTRANRTSMESTRSELLTFENDSFGEYIKRFGEEMENDYRSFNNLRGSQTHIASQRMELDSIAGNQVAISIKGKVVLKSEVAESGNLEVAPVKSRALKEKRVYVSFILVILFLNSGTLY